jgi:fucose 4-O-acetylase-like acetyltransferase
MACAPELTDRRSDLDALRALAMLLGIALHAALAYIGGFWVVNDREQAPALGLLVAGVHGFRMPMFFLLSGFFSAMLWERRGTAGLVSHRTRRILLPFVLSCCTILPIMHAVTTWAGARQNALADSARAQAPTDLWEAAAVGDVTAIRGFATSAGSLDAADPRLGITALAWAAITDKPEAIGTLLELGANPNARNWDGNTPLHAACFLGREAIARRLLEAGADPRLVGREGHRPADVMRRDEESTRAIAAVLKIPFDFAAITAGRARIAELLGGPPDSAARATPPEDAAAGGRASRGSAWLARLGSDTFLAHLWFLWFLCFFNLGFAAVAAAGRFVGRVSLPGWLFSMPGCLAWVVPLTMIPQHFMHDRGTSPGFGPDTSAGIVPSLHVLAYYAIFFGVGAMMHVAHGTRARIGRAWWVLLGAAVVLLPVALVFAYQPTQAAAWVESQTSRRLIANLLEVLYAWLALFGMIGLCERVLARPRPWTAYLAGSAYWLYLAHLPVVIALQAALLGWDAHPAAKFVLVVLATTTLLLSVYQFAVRGTIVGVVLNGRRGA